MFHIDGGSDGRAHRTGRAGPPMLFAEAPRLCCLPGPRRRPLSPDNLSRPRGHRSCHVPRALVASSAAHKTNSRVACWIISACQQLKRWEDSRRAEPLAATRHRRTPFERLSHLSSSGANTNGKPAGRPLLPPPLPLPRFTHGLVPWCYSIWCAVCSLLGRNALSMSKAHQRFSPVCSVISNRSIQCTWTAFGRQYAVGGKGVALSKGIKQ